MNEEKERQGKKDRWRRREEKGKWTEGKDTEGEVCKVGEKEKERKGGSEKEIETEEKQAKFARSPQTIVCIVALGGECCNLRLLPLDSRRNFSAFSFILPAQTRPEKKT